jgi:hypothetical protein
MPHKQGFKGDLMSPVNQPLEGECKKRIEVVPRLALPPQEDSHGRRVSSPAWRGVRLS